jgi:hypothetical protein
MSVDPELLPAYVLLRGRFPVVRAVRSAVDGFPLPLALIIETGRPLSRRERKCIADYIRGKFDPIKERGRPRKRLHHPRSKADLLRKSVVEAAKDVRAYKQFLRDGGQNKNIHNVAVAHVIEQWCLHGFRLTEEQLNNALKRSNPRK